MGKLGKWGKMEQGKGGEGENGGVGERGELGNRGKNGEKGKNGEMGKDGGGTREDRGAGESPQPPAPAPAPSPSPLRCPRSRSGSPRSRPPPRTPRAPPGGVGAPPNKGRGRRRLLGPPHPEPPPRGRLKNVPDSSPPLGDAAPWGWGGRGLHPRGLRGGEGGAGPCPNPLHPPGFGPVFFGAPLGSNPPRAAGTGGAGGLRTARGSPPQQGAAA